MTRDDAVEYISAEFSVLETATGTLAADAPDGYQYVINRALRAIGFEQSEIEGAEVEDGDVASFESLLDYYALKKFVRSLATEPNVNIDGISVNYDDLRKAAVAQLAAAEVEVAGLGLVTITGDWSMGVINLDILEPAETF